MFEELFKLIGKLATGVDNVLKHGLTEHVDARFSILGRRIGISCEISVMDQPAAKTP